MSLAGNEVVRVAVIGTTRISENDGRPSVSSCPIDRGPRRLGHFDRAGGVSRDSHFGPSAGVKRPQRSRRRPSAQKACRIASCPATIWERRHRPGRHHSPGPPAGGTGSPARWRRDRLGTHEQLSAARRDQTLRPPHRWRVTHREPAAPGRQLNQAEAASSWPLGRPNGSQRASAVSV